MLSYFPLHDLKAYVNLLYLTKLFFNEFLGCFTFIVSTNYRDLFKMATLHFVQKNVVHVYEFQVYLHYRFFLILKIKFSDSVTCLFIKIVGSKLENGFERCICIEFKFHQRLIFASFALFYTFRCNFPF